MTLSLTNIKEAYLSPTWNTVKKWSSLAVDGKTFYPTPTVQKVLIASALLTAYGSINSSLGSFDRIILKGFLALLPIYGIIDGLGDNTDILNLLNRVGSIASLYSFNSALNSSGAHFLTKLFIGGYFSAVTLGPKLPERIIAIGLLGYNAFSLIQKLPFSKPVSYLSKAPIDRIPTPFNSTPPLVLAPTCAISLTPKPPTFLNATCPLPPIPKFAAPIPKLNEKLVSLPPKFLLIAPPSSPISPILNLKQMISPLVPKQTLVKKDFILNPFPPTITTPNPLPVTPPIPILTEKVITLTTESNAQVSSSLLPLIAGIAVVCVVGYGAFKLYQRYKTPPSINVDRVSSEFQEAVAIYNDTKRNLVSRYILSSVGFSKAALYNTARTIKHIVLALLGLLSEDGRAFFKINCAKAASSIRQAGASSLGIICPPLVAGV